MGVVAPPRAKHARPSWIPPSGELIGARYRVEVVLGAGGMGAVVAGVDTKLAQNVAIKFLNPKLAHDAEQISRFLREAQATSRIRAEHVVRVLDVGATEDGLQYIVMERLEGTDLGDLVARGPLPIQLAVDCILQAAEALAEAHAAGIVHRDIKPSNLWLSHRSDGSPLLKVLDFGISKLAPAEGSDDPKLTETQAVFGSPTYMSPEQIRSAKKVDSSTDVWALGVVLHELLTARSPFEGESVAAVLASVSADPPAPLLAARPDAPAELANAILRCLDKDRSRRISLKELAKRLRPLATTAGAVSADRIMNAGAPIASLLPPPPMPSSVPRPVAFAATDAALATTRLAPTGAGPRRMLTMTGVALVLSVVAVGGTLAFRTRASSKHSGAVLAPAVIPAIPESTAPRAVSPNVPPESSPQPSASTTAAPASTNAMPAPSSRRARPAVGVAAGVPSAPTPESATAQPSASAAAPTSSSTDRSKTRH